MSKKRRKQPPEEFRLVIDGQEIPAKVYRELRANVRASIGKRAAILRLPIQLGAAEEQQRIQWFREWVSRQIRKNEGLAAHFDARDYQDGSLLQVGRRHYRLKVQYESRRTHSGKLLPDNTIHLKLSQEDKGQRLQRNIQHLLSRIIAQDFLPEISRRVHELNGRHFRQPLGQVRLKYNFSNWGSCSGKRNINLSTRLLFAPDEVIDYVIIHELAHLIEMNHSPRFWKLVAQAMPDYEEKERWLKEEGSKLSF